MRPKFHLALIFFIFQSLTLFAVGYWTPSTNISNGSFTPHYPQIVNDPEGTSLVVWLQGDGEHDRIFFSQRPKGGDWNVPHALSETGENANTPSFAINSAGHAVVIYRGGYVIKSATLPFKGEWTTPIVASTTTAQSPVIAIDSSGNSIATWLLTPDIGIVSAQLPFNGTAWTPQVLISGDYFPSANQIAVTASGKAIAGWSNPGIGSFLAKSIYNGESWQPREYFSGYSASDLSVAAISSVDFLAIWAGTSWNPPYGAHFCIQAEIFGERARSFDVVSLKWEDARFPKVAVDHFGNVIAVWYSSDGTQTTIQTSMLQNDASRWETPVTISAADESSTNPKIAIDSKGNIVVIWQAVSNGVYTIQCAFKPVNGKWTTPMVIKQDNSPLTNPSVTLVGSNLVAIWTNGNFVQASNYLPRKNKADVIAN